MRANQENSESVLLSSICVPINNSDTLREYDLEKKDWEDLLDELKNSGEPDKEELISHIKGPYGDKNRNALMSILVCHLPLQLVKSIVEWGGDDTVTEVGGCGFDAVHYTCWSNISLEVIQYLLGIGGKSFVIRTE